MAESIATRPLTERQIARRQRILETAREQLEAQGYDGLNMRDLALTAEVSPTTLYNLFQSKDILILSALRDLLDGLAERAAETQTSGMEFMIARQEIYGRNIIDMPRYSEAMTLMLFNAGPDDPITRVLLTDTIAGMREQIVAMQEAREVRPDIDLEFAARSVAVSTWSTLLLWAKQIVPTSTFVHEYVRAAVAALAPFMTPRTLRDYSHLLSAPAESTGV